jgi:hypothetical protein
MRPKKLCLLLTILFTVTTVSAALAVPTRLAQQGRLLDGDGAPLTGTHALIFAIYDAAADGNEVWREERSVDFEEGYYAVVLGALVPVDDLLFSGGAVWLELTVDGSVLSPRQEIVSVPWALRATSAEHVDGGVVEAAEISVGGVPVIDSTGAWVGPTPSVDWTELTGVPADIADGDQDTDTDTLAGLACAEAEVPKWDATSGLWICGTDVDTVDPNTDTLADLGLSCLAGQIARYSSSSGLWLCDAETLTTTLPWSAITGVPGDIADGDQDTVVTALPWSAITGIPGDIADGDADTQLTAQQVEDFVTDGPLDLDAGTTIGGQGISTQASRLFGGTGADGALLVPAGTTTIDLNGAAYFVGNYTSIEISGTGQLVFGNPHDSGTVVILRSQGSVDITSTAVPAIDLRGVGAAPLQVYNPGNSWPRPSGTGVLGGPFSEFDFAPPEVRRDVRLAAGGSGADSQQRDGLAGQFVVVPGGRGGGGLSVEVAGALDFSGVIDASGMSGGIPTISNCGGGGGGGSAGRVVILYNTLVSNSGAIINEGGVGGVPLTSGCQTAGCSGCSVNYGCSGCVSTGGSGGRGFGGNGGGGGTHDYGAPYSSGVGPGSFACPDNLSPRMSGAGAGGAGGGGNGTSGNCASPGAGGPSGNNLVIQNTVFP